MVNKLKAFGYAVLVDDVVYFEVRWLNLAVVWAGRLYIAGENIVEIRNAQNLNILLWRNGVMYAGH